MNRVDELNKLAESLDGTTIARKKIWVVVDKQRKLLLKGNKRHGSLVLISDVKDRKKAVQYSCEKAAKWAIDNAWPFYKEKGVQEYLESTYAEAKRNADVLEAVEAKLVIKI